MTSTITVCQYQHTASSWHRTDFEALTGDTGRIRHTSRKDTHVNAGWVKREPLLRCENSSFITGETKTSDCQKNKRADCQGRESASENACSHQARRYHKRTAIAWILSGANSGHSHHSSGLSFFRP